MTDANSPLTEDEIDQLSEFLDSLASPDAMNIERLDGFFCALIAGPAAVKPSEYWPRVIGAATDEQQPSFENVEQAREILSLLLRHWNTIVRTLGADEVYLPILLLEEANAARGIDWAKGFLDGIDMRREAWQRLFSNDGDIGLAFPMLALARADHPDPEKRFTAPTTEKREELLHMMTAHLVQIFRYFKADRAASALPASTPITRGSAKIGRNDLCPCGSGKKHKRCCMLTLH